MYEKYDLFYYRISLNDKDFIAFCKSDVDILGGAEGIRLFNERMKKLGIV